MARLQYEIDAAYEAEVQRRCWSPWQRASGFVKLLINLLKLVALIGGAWYAHDWFPHTLVENQFIYWGGFAMFFMVYWMIINLITGTSDPNAPDLTRGLLSPVGQHVWDNLAEYTVISNIVSSKMKQ